MSIRILAGWYGDPARWPSANTARCTRRATGIRRIYPSQWCLRVRTAVSRSYEVFVASSRYDLPVMRCSWRELKPLALAPTPRCRALRSSKRSLPRGTASVIAVNGYRATGSRGLSTARPRCPSDGAFPPRRLRRW